LNKDQEELWDVYMTIKEVAVSMSKGNPIVLFHLGDMGQGFYFTEEANLSDISNQVVAAAWNLYPFYDLPNCVGGKLVSGNRGHEGTPSALTRLIAFIMGEKYSDKRTEPLLHGETTIGNYRIDYSHVGPNQSARTWLEGNIARYYLRSEMQSHLNAGEKPPDLYLRGHFHSRIFETVRQWVNNSWVESSIIVVPPLCMMGDHARKVTKSGRLLTYGGIVANFDDGNITDLEWVTRTKDIRKKDDLTQWITEPLPKKQDVLMSKVKELEKIKKTNS